MSTGSGFVIGIPRAPADVLSAAVAALGRAKRGIQLDLFEAQGAGILTGGRGLNYGWEMRVFGMDERPKTGNL